MGLMEVRVGAGALTIVKFTELALVAPPEFVVVICLGPPWVEAVSPMLRVAVTVVSLTTTTFVAVIFEPETITAVVPVRPEPVIVTGTLLPLVPWVGAMEVSLGCTMVKVTAPVVPPAVVTVTFLAPELAFPAIAKVAVIWVALLTVNEGTVTPFPDTLIEDTLMKLVPVRTILVYVSP